LGYMQVRAAVHIDSFIARTFSSEMYYSLKLYSHVFNESLYTFNKITPYDSSAD
jgi:hypothetical protein